jgi:hypothetical protein
VRGDDARYNVTHHNPQSYCFLRFTIIIYMINKQIIIIINKNA